MNGMQTESTFKYSIRSLHWTHWAYYRIGFQFYFPYLSSFFIFRSYSLSHSLTFLAIAPPLIIPSRGLLHMYEEGKIETRSERGNHLIAIKGNKFIKKYSVSCLLFACENRRKIQQNRNKSRRHFFAQVSKFPSNYFFWLH